jgi:uncharacterized membrane-anchored protein
MSASMSASPAAVTRAAPCWAFLAAFVIQAALLAWIIADRALLLARGAEIRLAVVPVDPRDLLRGDYVVLSYPISRLDAGRLGGDDVFNIGQPVFVALRKEGDGWAADAIYEKRPSGAFGIAGVVNDINTGTGKCGTEDCLAFSVGYNLEKFFVPEGQGRELEKLRNGRRLEVDVAVGSNGHAALKRLLVDGTPAFQETFF